MLGNVLRFTVKRKKKDGNKILVLGIPRGGVIVADIVAKKLNADFDIVTPRKLSAPNNKENAIGAVMEDGSLYLDDFLVNSLKVSQQYIEREKQEQLQEIERRRTLFRPPSSNNNEYNLKYKTVVLVDDGITLNRAAASLPFHSLGSLIPICRSISIFSCIPPNPQITFI